MPFNPQGVGKKTPPRSQAPGSKQAHTTGDSQVQSASECHRYPPFFCPDIKKNWDIFRNCCHVEYVSNG